MDVAEGWSGEVLRGREGSHVVLCSWGSIEREGGIARGTVLVYAFILDALSHTIGFTSDQSEPSHHERTLGYAPPGDGELMSGATWYVWDCFLYYRSTEGWKGGKGWSDPVGYVVDHQGH